MVRYLRFGVAAAGLATLGIFLSGVTAAQQSSARSGRKAEHGARRLPRSAGPERVSAGHPRQGNRWIAYVGHHGGTALNPLTGQQESNGTSIVDVTDPKQPRYLAHIPGEAGQGEAGGAQMVRVCDGSAAAARRQEQGVPAAHVRQHRPRDLGRHRSREAERA